MGKIFTEESPADDLRNTLHRYAKVVGVHQESDTGQWVWIQIEWGQKKFKWQTAGGSLRRSTERRMIRWVVGQEGREKEWTLERWKGRICSNPTNSGILTWAILWQDVTGQLIVGETIEVVKSMARGLLERRIVGNTFNAAMRELGGYGTIGTWERIEGTEVKEDEESDRDTDSRKKRRQNTRRK